MITTDILVMLVAVVGKSMTTIGVVIALFVRLDRRIAGLNGLYHKLADDITSLQVGMARIEGYLKARDGFMTAVADPPDPSASIE